MFKKTPLPPVGKKAEVFVSRQKAKGRFHSYVNVNEDLILSVYFKSYSNMSYIRGIIANLYCPLSIVFKFYVDKSFNLFFCDLFHF